MAKKQVTNTELRKLFLDEIATYPEAKELTGNWREVAAIGFYREEEPGAWELGDTIGGTNDDEVFRWLVRRAYTKLITEYDLI